MTSDTNTTTSIKVHTWSQFEFACWVPTITGQLSFSELGKATAKFPYNYFVSNRISPKLAKRSFDDIQGQTPDIILLQRRPNPEFAWWQRLLGLVLECAEIVGLPISDSIKAYFPTHSTMFYILEGSVTACQKQNSTQSTQAINEDKLGLLTGKVHIIRKRNWSMNAKLSHLFAKAVSSDGSPEKWKDFQELLDKFAKDVVSFNLYRSGELRLKLPHEILDWVPSEGEVKSEDTPHQVRQAYYFLKDCAHHHYHHDAQADQMLRVTKTLNRSEDARWRRETLWDLSKAVIKMRRERQLFRRRDALGVIAYAESFQTSLAKVKRSDSDNEAFEVNTDLVEYDFNHLRQSIASENDSQTFRRQGSSSIFIACFAAFFSLAMMHHSASSIILSQGLSDICIIDEDYFGYLSIVIGLIFLMVWDLFYHRKSWIGKIRNFFTNANSSIVKNRRSIIFVGLFGFLLTTLGFSSGGGPAHFIDRTLSFTCF